MSKSEITHYFAKLQKGEFFFYRQEYNSYRLGQLRAK